MSQRYIKLNLSQAGRVLVYLEDLNYLYTEQLRDREHPLGEGERDLLELKGSISRKIERAKHPRRRLFGSQLSKLKNIMRDIERLQEQIDPGAEPLSDEELDDLEREPE